MNKRVFLDTNILMEYLANREQVADVKLILKAAYQGKMEACMSAGCLYTLIYLLGLYLKNKGIHEPDKTQQIKDSLSTILGYVDIVDISKEYVKNAINATDFKDLEDSCQYQCAVENDCDILLTINIKHFNKIRILNVRYFIHRPFFPSILGSPKHQKANNDKLKN